MECIAKCGKCCKAPLVNTIKFSMEDLDRWRREGRKDILEIVDDWARHKETCPFLKDNKCSIQETKPETCIKYLCTNGRVVQQHEGKKAYAWAFKI